MPAPTTEIATNRGDDAGRLARCESVVRSLRRELAARDERISHLEGELVRMSLELASSRAREDEHRLLLAPAPARKRPEVSRVDFSAVVSGCHEAPRGTRTGAPIGAGGTSEIENQGLSNINGSRRPPRDRNRSLSRSLPDPLQPSKSDSFFVHLLGERSTWSGQAPPGRRICAQINDRGGEESKEQGSYKDDGSLLGARNRSRSSHSLLKTQSLRALPGLGHLLGLGNSDDAKGAEEARTSDGPGASVTIALSPQPRASLLSLLSGVLFPTSTRSVLAGCLGSGREWGGACGELPQGVGGAFGDSNEEWPEF